MTKRKSLNPYFSQGTDMNWKILMFGILLISRGGGGIWVEDKNLNIQK